MKKITNGTSRVNNKRGFSADVAPLSSALRPRLLNLILISGLVFIGIINFSNTSNVSALQLNLTIPKNISLNVNPNANNGFGESDSGEISVSTDSISGYTLNVKSKNTSNDLLNSAGNSKLSSITENLTLDQYKNGSNGKTYVNTWAFKPNTINHEANTNYVPGPDNIEGITLAKTDVDNSIPATYAVAIAAKVDNTIPAGNYSNTFVLTATANEAHYTINYDATSLSGATNASSFTIQTGVITGSTQQINTTTPTKGGYEFTGWCSQPLEGDGSCKGGVFQPGAYYPMCKCDTDVRLYAMWKPSIPTTMQEFDSYCVWMNQGDILTLTDSRDSISYKIAKLKDNKCWMVENLRIQNKNLTSNDSDVSSNFSLPASINSSFSGWDVANVHIDSTYGGYYSWYAATAGTGSNSMSSGNATSSICPKGWRLPTGGSSGDFQTLVKAYGGIGDTENNSTVCNALTSSPGPAFVYSGFYLDSSARNQGSSGSWWSSTAFSSNNAYVLTINNNGYVYPLSNGGNKYYGSSVRCVAKS